MFKIIEKKWEEVIDLTGMQALKSELLRVQQAQVECINDNNIVRSCYRYRYQLLTEEARNIRNGIEWFTKLKQA